ncbi:MAG TPA: ATP-binding protein [Pyrinomonadaceae bacterium]|nr:ATP-binding protein [Pyrinomonadaceae bacterium]
MDDQLLSEFLAGAEEIIEGLHGDMASLRARSAEGRARRELVGRIFRRVHTIKGTASAAGLEATERLAHEFESLLDSVRLGRAALDDAALEAAEAAVGAIAASLSDAAKGVPTSAPQELVERLRLLAVANPNSTARGPDDAQEFETLPCEVERALGEHERQRLREAAREGALAYVVSADFDLATFDEQFRRLSEALGECGEVVSTQPFVNADAPERVGFRIVCASERPREELSAHAAAFGAVLPDEETAMPFDDAAGEDVGAQGAELSASSLTTPVRVSLEELDDIIWSAHGLFAEAARALDLASPPGAQREESESHAADIRRRFVELEERLTGLRMVPLRATLERVARAGRTVARASGKSVEFEVAGGDVRLDKSLADRIAEPLLHLLRNAVDHGIETAQERRAAGKPESGRVRVEATAEGSRVMLRVSDDGRGVDAEMVARVAAARGLVAPGARLREEQALRLIFRPGFSTAARTSLISGRGVGLEVVERAVEETGGEVRVRTERGRGTSFELRLSTTLALLDSLIVRSSGHGYCVDAARVVETGHAEHEDITSDGARQSLRWRGRDLPLARLDELLGQRAGEEAGAGAAARLAFFVARAGGRRDEGEEDEDGRVAVVVDSWEAHTQALVRGLGRHATRWRGVGGATELSDGTVALVLDLPRLLETRE